MYFIAVALSFALCVPALSPLVAVLKTRLAGDGHGQWRIPMVYNPFQCSWYKRNRKAMSLDSLAKNTPLWIALNDAAKKNHDQTCFFCWMALHPTSNVPVAQARRCLCCRSTLELWWSRAAPESPSSIMWCHGDFSLCRGSPRSNEKWPPGNVWQMTHDW